MDPSARNFNPEADEDCCCEYPDLKVEFTYSYDTLAFQENTRFVHDVHDSIKVLDFYMVLSDFTVTDVASNVYEIMDSTEFVIHQNGINVDTFIHDDLMLLGDAVSYTIGEFRINGIYQSLHFSTGMNDEWQRVIPDELSGHVLSKLDDRGNYQDLVGYNATYIKVAYGSALGDTVSLRSPIDQLRVPAMVSFQITKLTSQDLIVLLDMDMKEFLNGVDFSQSSEMVFERLLTNFQSPTCIKYRG